MRRQIRSALIASLLAFVANHAAAQPQMEAPLLPPSYEPASAAALEASQPWMPPEATAGEELPLPADGSPLETLSPYPSPEAYEGILSEEDMLGEMSQPWYRPTGWFGPAPWETSLELGINGSTGTSESLSIRTGGNMKRESRFSKLAMSSNYNRTTRGGTATQDNAQLDVRNDWLLDESSPWTLYGTGNLFYDHFASFDVQANANTGVGYRFIHEPGLQLMARVGAGASREVGGPDDRWVPESLFGLEYSQNLSALQKFYGKLDYFPEWEEIGEYRLVADMGWEIQLVQPSNLSLKVSASDRFDSTPNGANPHLVNYSILLLLKL